MREQNIFFGNEPMGLCANKIFFRPLKIHFLSKSRSGKKFHGTKFNFKSIGDN
jgi:hypothetical protein